MIGTIKTIVAGALSWWREYRALHPDRRRFVTVSMACILIVYFIVSTMSWKSGEIDGQRQMIAALSNIAPAVEAIRASCRNRWESSNDCELFYLLRERTR